MINPEGYGQESVDIGLGRRLFLLALYLLLFSLYVGVIVFSHYFILIWLLNAPGGGFYLIASVPAKGIITILLFVGVFRYVGFGSVRQHILSFIVFSFGSFLGSFLSMWITSVLMRIS